LVVAAVAADQSGAAAIAKQTSEQPATEQLYQKEFWEILENENQEI
jgi:hypothetical protein